jgi:hypothetical protein
VVGAGVCAACGGTVPPMDRIAGTDRGHCPDCDREVAVLEPGAPRLLAAPPSPMPAAPRPMPAPPVAAPWSTPKPAPPEPPLAVLATIPTSAPVATTALTVAREEPDAVSAPVVAGDGPFRSAAFVERRQRGALVIEKRGHRILPIAAVLAVTLPLTAAAGALGLPDDIVGFLLVLDFVAIAETLRRARTFVKVTATELIVRSSGSPSRTVPRAWVTGIQIRPDHAHVVAPLEGQRWLVGAIAGDEYIRVAETGEQAEASAIANLLAHELGHPAWTLGLPPGERGRR